LNDGIADYLKDIDYTTTWAVSHHTRFLILSNIIKKNGFKKVFDVGFGQAVLPKYLDMLRYDGEYLGVDLNEQYVFDAMKRKDEFNFKTRFYCKPAYELDEKFDCIVLGELIEHLAKKEAKKFLLHCKSILNDGGYILLTTPNKHESINWPADHEDEYSYDELESLFKSCGLKIKDAVGLWSNTKDTFSFIDSIEQEMYVRYEKIVPNSLLNVLFNIVYPKKSKHLLFILTK